MMRLLRFLRTTFTFATISAAIFAFLAFTPASVLAQDALEEVAGAAEIDTTQDIYTIIGTIINIFFGILGIIFLILIIYSGFLWMTAGGNADQVDKAKKILINGTIGLVITLSAFAITTFILNAISQATGVGGGATVSDGVSTEPLSGSLGSGVISSHYPARGATDVPRNTKIFVTFKQEMNIESFIEGYSTAGTPTDTSDDVVATALNAENVQIYATADGQEAALASEDVSVGFTSDLKTFTFDPPVLGSATEDVNYTVLLADTIQNADGQTPINLGGYQWSFTVGTELDLTPPEVKSVIPKASGTYDRNIVVQIDFTEAVDPTSATGLTDEGFENIRVNADGSVVSGTYEISNEYKTVTFTTTDVCGTNSCGETIYCLPGNSSIEATIFAATPGDEPPQAESFPYDGIVDVVGNSLDGDGDWGEGDGEVGDDYVWAFSTTDDVNLSSPEIETISPDINGSDVDLDQDVVITFGCQNSTTPSTCDAILMSSTISSDNIALAPSPEHELWYSFNKEDLTSDGAPVESEEDTAEKTGVTVDHGIFLESTDEQTYTYEVRVDEGIRNQYQNCYVPAEGPDASGGRCNTSASEPYCCSGTPSATICPEL